MSENQFSFAFFVGCGFAALGSTTALGFPRTTSRG
jgi:hypothetical protein